MESPQQHNPSRSTYLEQLRLRLAGRSALRQLCVPGPAFRGFVKGARALLLPDNIPENCEQLTPHVRWLLPMAGGVLLALICALAGSKRRQGGVVQVLKGDAAGSALRHHRWRSAGRLRHATVCLRVKAWRTRTRTETRRTALENNNALA